MRAEQVKPPAQPLVFVVDDDASFREAVGRLIRSDGLQVKLLASASEFLVQDIPDAPCCLVLDVELPGLSGLDFQAELAASNIQIPIIFITGHGSIPMSVQAMRAGAVTFLPKPVRLAELAAAVREAFERDRRWREEKALRSEVESRLRALTSREREVLALIVVGKLNKQIAAELGAAEKTIKVHRGRVMAKLNVRSVAELVSLTGQVMGRPENRPPPG
jgi:FixJ family two-component response regulator